MEVDRSGADLDRPTEGRPPGRARRLVVRALALLALLSGGLFPFVATADALARVGQEQVLEPAGSPEAQYGADHPAETVHIPGAIAMGAITVSGVVGLMIRPASAALATQTGAVGVAMLAVAGIIGDPDNHGGQGLPVDPAVVALAVPVLATAAAAAPWREWRRGSVDLPRVLLVALLAIPAFRYGVDHALLQRNTWPPLADPHHQGHWMMMAQLAFAVPLVTGGASLHGVGSRVAATTAAGGALAVGVASMVAPRAASALSSGWAIAVMLWGAALLTATWTRSSRDR